MLPQMALFHCFFMAEQYQQLNNSSIPFIHVPHVIYPLICLWTFRLFPYLGYCKQCCNEHWAASIFSKIVSSGQFPQERSCQIIWQLYFQFFKEPPFSFPWCLHHFTFPPILQEGSLPSTSSSAFVICMMVILTSVRQYLIVALICIFLMIRHDERLYLYLLIICMC